MYNSVAKAIFALALTGCIWASGARADEVCTKVQQVFFGMNDIAKKGNTKIVPFTKGYEAELAAYFDRGCPKGENFPSPKPGTDMQLAVTAGDIVVSGKIKLALGKPLIR